MKDESDSTCRLHGKRAGCRSGRRERKPGVLLQKPFTVKKNFFVLEVIRQMSVNVAVS